MTKFEKIITGLLVVVLLSTWVMYRDVKSEISNLGSNENRVYSNLSNQINNIRRDVDKALEGFNKENQWLRNAEFEIYWLDDKYETAKVKYEVQLNEINESDNIYLSVINQDNKLSGKIEMNQKDNSLIFESDIYLSTKFDYSVEIVRENGTLSTSQDIKPIYLSSYIETMIQVYGELEFASYNHKKKSGQLIFNVNVVKSHKNKFQGEVDIAIEIKTVTAELYVGRELMDTIDVLNDKTYYVEPKDRNSTWEFSEEEEVVVDYQGDYRFKREMDKDSMASFVLLVKVTDGSGREYKEVFGDYSDSDFVEELLEKGN